MRAPVRRWLSRAAVAAGVIAALALAADRLYPRPGSDAAQAALAEGPPPVPVRAATVVAQTMPVRIAQIGTVQPLASVAVKSRIDGQIVKVGFQEGDYVEAGDMLFQLDERALRARLVEAEANLTRETVQLADARRTLERNLALAQRGFASQAALDTLRANVEALQASVGADAAQIDNFRTQLDYTVIRAPISGRTGAQELKLGANVKANDTAPLVTINQTRPIAVAFSVPQSELAAIRDAQARRPLPVTVRVRGSRPVTAEGALTFIDNAVDRMTGTIVLKATLANADEALWPGQFVDVSVLVDARPDVPAVPSPAVLIGQQGSYVFVIGAGGTVEPRPVTVDLSLDDTAFIGEGLAAGERVVTDGQMRLAPGSRVIIRDPEPPPGEDAGRPGR